MKIFTKSLLALCLLLALGACDSKGIYYPIQPEGETPAQTQCVVTIPVDWTLVDPVLPLRTSSHLYIYDVDGNFVSKTVAEAGKDFVVTLEKETTYNFFVSDNLLTAQQEENSLNLENTEDYYAINFTGTNYSTESHLDPVQGTIMPYSYVSLSGYTTPNAESATTQTLIPTLGSVKSIVNIGSQLEVLEIGYDLNTNTVTEIYDQTGQISTAITTDQVTVTYDSANGFSVTAIDPALESEINNVVKMLSANMLYEFTAGNITISADKMRGNLSVHNPDYSNLPVVASAGKDNYKLSVGDTSEAVIVHYRIYESDNFAYIYIGATANVVAEYHTFGYTGDKRVLPTNMDTFEVALLTLTSEYLDWNDELRTDITEYPVLTPEQLQTVPPGAHSDIAVFTMEEKDNQLTYIYNLLFQVGGPELSKSSVK